MSDKKVPKHMEKYAERIGERNLMTQKDLRQARVK